MKFTEAEKKLFNEIYETSQPKNAKSYSDVKRGDKVYDYDDEYVGEVIAKGKAKDLIGKYDSYNAWKIDPDEDDYIPGDLNLNSVAVESDSWQCPYMVFNYGTEMEQGYCKGEGRSSPKHAKSGKVSFEDISIDMIAYSNEDDKPVGVIVAKSKDIEDLREYDVMGDIDEVDEWPDCEGFIAVKLLKEKRDYLDPTGIAIFLYGGNDPSGAYCTF